MPPVFLPQAQAQYPGNADFSKQLALLGDTIGQGVANYRKQSLLSDVLKPDPDGKVDHQAVTMKLLQAGFPQEAQAVASMGQQKFSQAMDQARLGLEGRRVDIAGQTAASTDRYHQGQLGISGAQLKIAQEAEKRAAAMDALRKGLLTPLLAGPDQPTLLTPPPQQAAPSPPSPPQQQPIQFSPGSVGMPPAVPPQAPTFDNRFSGLPQSSGVPRNEMALSLLGYKDTAKLLSEERKNQPDYIARTAYSKQVGEQRAKSEEEQPKSLASAEASIQAAGKAANEAVRLMAHPGLEGATGPIAGRLPSTREKTANFDADLDSLKTKVFVTAINEMRALSKTGGALGSVTEKEIAKMENSWQALTQVQGPGNLRNNLGRLAEDFNDSMARISRAYEMQYGKKLQYQKIEVPKQPAKPLPKYGLF